MPVVTFHHPLELLEGKPLGSVRAPFFRPSRLLSFLFARSLRLYFLFLYV